MEAWIGLVGAVIGGLLIAIPNWLIQGRQLKEAKRTEWKSYLLMLMTRLLDARQEYEQFLGSSMTDAEHYAGIVGKAISACLATTDETLTDLATKELTPYFVKDALKKDWPSRNRDAMHGAVSRLAELIKEA